MKRKRNHKAGVHTKRILFSLFGHSKFKPTLMTLLLSGGQTTSRSFTMEPEVL